MPQSSCFIASSSSQRKKAVSSSSSQACNAASTFCVSSLLWLKKSADVVITTARLAARLSPGCAQGRPLRLLAGPQRGEAGWGEGESGTGLARRDYFLAHNAAAGSVWVFRDRATGGWFLQGVYGWS